MPPGGVSPEDIRYVNTHPPLLTEVGLATWYTAPYKGRKAANGEVFRRRRLSPPPTARCPWVRWWW